MTVQAILRVLILVSPLLRYLASLTRYTGDDKIALEIEAAALMLNTTIETHGDAVTLVQLQSFTVKTEDWPE